MPIKEGLNCPAPEMREQVSVNLKDVTFTADGKLQLICPQIQTPFQTREVDGVEKRIKAAVCKATGNPCPYGAHPEGHVESSSTFLKMGRPNLAPESDDLTRSPGTFVEDAQNWLVDVYMSKAGADNAQLILDVLSKEAAEVGVQFERMDKTPAEIKAERAEAKQAERDAAAAARKAEGEARTAEFSNNPVKFLMTPLADLKAKAANVPELLKVVDRYETALTTYFDGKVPTEVLQDRQFMGMIKRINGLWGYVDMFVKDDDTEITNLSRIQVEGVINHIAWFEEQAGIPVPELQPDYLKQPLTDIRSNCDSNDLLDLLSEYESLLDRYFEDSAMVPQKAKNEMKDIYRSLIDLRRMLTGETEAHNGDIPAALERYISSFKTKIGKFKSLVAA